MPLTVRNGGGGEIAKLYERSYVLVRPDGRVAWRGDDPPRDPAAFADTVRGDRAEAVRGDR
ncbi:aromatic-ring hydroxylase C-terminal domain-containing protein [Streptomyces jumonjinensis]|uniref:aromatic-ring hydroxylase C-terminal domain-containing protein n=1 Tax=Streptomyces jumonjinensis TaxID=1945 RepID=UPI00378CD032